LSRVALLLGVLASVWLVGRGLPGADATRRPRTVKQARVFVPDARTARAAAFGFEEPLADLLWSRAAVEFGRAEGRAAHVALQGWFAATVETTLALDPRWRTPYFYGGVLARLTEDYATSSRVFERGAEAFPEDWFFPANRGINATLYENDPATAAVWMERAAALPGAPFWYRANAAAARAKGGQRDLAIAMLERDLAVEEDPGVRGDMEQMLGKLRHEALVEAWAPACRARRAEGRPLRAPDELAALGFALPENPRGDAWVVGSDGVVRSERSERERVRRNRMDDRRWLAP
jgi:hypothetical protein